MAVQRITVALFASSIVSFGFVVLIQMAVGAGIIVSAGSRRASMTRALDLWFAGHVPYSLWLLVVAAAFAGCRGRRSMGWSRSPASRRRGPP
jgi:hypothetical protein